MYFYDLPLTVDIVRFHHHGYYPFASSSRERQRRRKLGSNRGLQRSANGIQRLPNLHNNCVYGSLLCHVGRAQAKSGKLLQGFCLAFVAICLIVVLLCRSFFGFLGRIGQTKSLPLWDEEGGGYGGVVGAACIVFYFLFACTVADDDWSVLYTVIFCINNIFLSFNKKKKKIMSYE